jgi:hypothetical protein
MPTPTLRRHTQLSPTIAILGLLALAGTASAQLAFPPRYFEFNMYGASIQLPDDSGNSIQGYYQHFASPYPTNTGKFGSGDPGRRLEATNYISAYTTNMDTWTAGSISFYIRPDGVTNKQFVIGRVNPAKTRGFALSIENSDILLEMWSNNGQRYTVQTNEDIIQAGVGVNIGFTFNATEAVLYAHGHEVARSSWTGNTGLGATSSDLLMGIRPWDVNRTDQRFYGEIDAVVGFPSALTARQMRQLAMRAIIPFDGTNFNPPFSFVSDGPQLTNPEFHLIPVGSNIQAVLGVPPHPLTSGRAVSFAGVPGSLTADFPASPSNFTIAAWIKPEGTTTRQDVISWRDHRNRSQGLTLLIEDGNWKFKLEHIDYQPIIIDGGPIRNLNWTHVGISKSGETIKLYENGVEVGNGTAYSPDLFKIQLGASAYNTENPYSGDLDEVVISADPLPGSIISKMGQLPVPTIAFPSDIGSAPFDVVVDLGGVAASFNQSQMTTTNATIPNFTRINERYCTVRINPIASPVTLSVVGGIALSNGYETYPSQPASKSYSDLRAWVTVDRKTVEGFSYPLSNQTITGTVQAGSSVSVNVNGTIFPATVTGTTWQSSVTVPSVGVHEVVATATSAIGLQSTDSTTNELLATAFAARYSLNSVGTLVDSIGVDNGAALTGTTNTWSTIRQALPNASTQSLNFGSNGTFEIPITSLTRGQIQYTRLTAAAWVFPESVTNGVIISNMDLAYTNGFSIRFQNSGLIFSSVIDGQSYEISTAAGVVQTGNLYHVAMVTDANAIRGYVNGVQVGEIHRRAYPWLNSMPVRLGAHAWDPNEGRLQGNIDEVFLASEALPDDAIASMALYSRFRMEEGATTRIQLDDNKNLSVNSSNSIPRASTGNQQRTMGSQAVDLDGLSWAESPAGLKEIDNLDAAAHNFYVSAWIYPRDVNTDQKIVSRTSGGVANGFILGIQSGRLKAEFFRNGNNVTAFSGNANEIPVNQWTHVAATLTDEGVKAFVNGVNVATNLARPDASRALGSTGGNGKLTIGTGDFSPLNYRFNGLVDDVRLATFKMPENLVLLQAQRPTPTLTAPPLFVNGQFEIRLDMNESFPMQSGVALKPSGNQVINDIGETLVDLNSHVPLDAPVFQGNVDYYQFDLALTHPSLSNLQLHLRRTFFGTNAVFKLSDFQLSDNGQRVGAGPNAPLSFIDDAPPVTSWGVKEYVRPFWSSSSSLTEGSFGLPYGQAILGNPPHDGGFWQLRVADSHAGSLAVLEKAEFLLNTSEPAVSSNGANIKTVVPINDLHKAYRVIVRPFASGQISIPANAVTDRFGVGNQASNVVSYTYDITPPTCLVQVPAREDSTVAVQFLFSEPVTGFALDDVIATGMVADRILDGETTTPTVIFNNTAPDGTKTIQLRAGAVIDRAGNWNTELSNVASTFRDTTPPVVVVNSQTTPDRTPLIVGTVNEECFGISVTINGVTYFPTLFGLNWAFEVTEELPDGVYSVNTSAADIVFNFGGDATNNELTIDTNIESVSVNNLLTNDSTPTIGGGVTPAGATVNLIVNGINYSTTAVNLSWSFTIPDALSDGTYNVVATVGSASDATSNELTVDATAPSVAIDRAITSDQTPLLTGYISESGLQVAVNVNGVAYVAPSSNNSWSVQVNEVLAEGAYDITASATDAAGNTGTDQEYEELLIDRTPPSSTVTTLVTNDSTPRLSGTTDWFISVAVTVNGVTYNTTSGEGTWEVDVTNALPEGVYSVDARGTDLAWNTEPAGPTANAIRIDTTAPAINSITRVGPSEFSGNTVSFEVTFSEAITDFDDVADINVNHSGTNHSGITFTPVSATVARVNLTGVTGFGSVSINVAANAVADAATNRNAASADGEAATRTGLTYGAFTFAAANVTGTAPNQTLVGPVNINGTLIHAGNMTLTATTVTGSGPLTLANASDRFPAGATMLSGAFTATLSSGDIVPAESQVSNNALADTPITFVKLMVSSNVIIANGFFGGTALANTAFEGLRIQLGASGQDESFDSNSRFYAGVANPANPAADANKFTFTGVDMTFQPFWIRLALSNGPQLLTISPFNIESSGNSFGYFGPIARLDYPGMVRQVTSLQFLPDAIRLNGLYGTVRGHSFTQGSFTYPTSGIIANGDFVAAGGTLSVAGKNIDFASSVIYSDKIRIRNVAVDSWGDKGSDFRFNWVDVVDSQFLSGGPATFLMSNESFSSTSSGINISATPDLFFNGVSVTDGVYGVVPIEANRLSFYPTTGVGTDNLGYRMGGARVAGVTLNVDSITIAGGATQIGAAGTFNIPPFDVTPFTTEVPIGQTSGLVGLQNLIGATATLTNSGLRLNNVTATYGGAASSRNYPLPDVNVASVMFPYTGTPTATGPASFRYSLVTFATNDVRFTAANRLELLNASGNYGVPINVATALSPNWANTGTVPGIDIEIDHSGWTASVDSRAFRGPTTKLKTVWRTGESRIYDVPTLLRQAGAPIVESGTQIFSGTSPSSSSERVRYEALTVGNYQPQWKDIRFAEVAMRDTRVADGGWMTLKNFGLFRNGIGWDSAEFKILGFFVEGSSASPNNGEDESTSFGVLRPAEFLKMPYLGFNFRISPVVGLIVEGFSFCTPNLPALDGFNLAHFCFEYAAGPPQEFFGAAELAIPEIISLGGELKFANGALDSFFLEGSGFDKPIGTTGLFMQSIGAGLNNIARVEKCYTIYTPNAREVCNVPPVQFRGISGVSFGPSATSILDADMTVLADLSHISVTGEPFLWGILRLGSAQLAAYWSGDRRGVFARAEIRIEKGRSFAAAALSAGLYYIVSQRRLAFEVGLEIAFRACATDVPGFGWALDSICTSGNFNVHMSGFKPLKVRVGLELAEVDVTVEVTMDNNGIRIEKENETLADWEIPLTLHTDANGNRILPGQKAGEGAIQTVKAFANFDRLSKTYGNAKSETTIFVVSQYKPVVVRLNYQLPAGDPAFSIQTPSNVVMDAQSAIDATTASGLPGEHYYGINPVLRESSMAFHPSELGTYTIVVQNPTSLGAYTLEVLVSNTAPAISFTNVANTASALALQWVDADPDDNAAIRFFLDNDRKDADGMPLMAPETSIAEDDTNNITTFDLTTSETLVGRYFVYALIDDGKNPPVAQYADAPIFLLNPDAPPAVENLDVTAYGGTAVVSWDYPTSDPLIMAWKFMWTDNVDNAHYDNVRTIPGLERSAVVEGFDINKVYRFAVVPMKLATGSSGKRAAMQKLVQESSDKVRSAKSIDLASFEAALIDGAAKSTLGLTDSELRSYTIMGTRFADVQARQETFRAADKYFDIALKTATRDAQLAAGRKAGEEQYYIDGYIAEIDTLEMLAVPGMNNNPVITSTPEEDVVTAGGPALNYLATATDADNDPVTFSLQNAAPGMSITPAGLLSWSTPAGTEGIYDVSIVAMDDNDGSDTQVITFHSVVVSMEAPTLLITSTPDLTIDNGLPYSYNVSTSTGNGGTVTYVLLDGPAGMTIDGSTGLVSWTAPATGTGDASVTLRATQFDGTETLEASQTFVIEYGTDMDHIAEPELIVDPGAIVVTETAGDTYLKEEPAPLGWPTPTILGDDYGIGLAPQALAPVVVTLTPEGELDLGSGPGVAHVVTLPPGANGTTPQNIPVRFTSALQATTPQFLDVVHTTESEDPDFDGLTGSVQVQVHDGTPLAVVLDGFTATVLPGGTGVRVQWATVNETNNAGFHVYCGVRTATGAWKVGERITPSLIPAIGDGGGEYEYLDYTEIGEGETRAYFLIDLELGGVMGQHGPATVTAEKTGVDNWLLLAE